MGRTPMLSLEDIEKISADVENGNYAKTVCIAHGITERTYYNYMERGRLLDKELSKKKRRLKKSEKIYLAFFQSMTKADAKSEVNAVKALRLQIFDNPSANLEFLARRFRERWGKNIMVGTADITPKDAGEPVDLKRLSPEQLERLAELEDEREEILNGGDNGQQSDQTGTGETEAS